MRFSVWLKVSRPGLWSTAVWFYLLPVGGVDVFDQWPFYAGLLYVTLPLGMFIYGWNDITDYATDEINPRKDSFLFGARPTQMERAKMPLRILLVQVPFVAYFLYVAGPKMCLVFAVAALAVTVNNWPKIGLKNWPVLDLLIQSSYLLVFVLCSWVNDVPQLPWQTFVFSAAFAMHAHLFGAIMDIDPDGQTGRRTTAVAIGRVPSKLVIALALVFEAAWVWHFFREWIVTGLLAVGALWFVLDALVLRRDSPYPPGQAGAFLLLWNAAAVLSAPWIWYTGTFTRVAQ